MIFSSRGCGPRRSAAVWWGVPLLGAAGCAGFGDAASQSALVRDSAGIRVVHNVRPAEEEGSGWRLSERPTLVIGARDGPEPYQLFAVSGARVLGDGRVVAANAGTGELRFFSPAGHYLGSAGRKGGGPGEFSYIGRLEAGPDGDLFVWDSSLDRLSRFSPDGEFEGSVQIPLGGAFSGTRLGGVLFDGSLVLRSTVHTFELRGADGVRRDPEHVLVYHPRAGTLDTLAELPGRERFVTTTERVWGAADLIFGRIGHIVVAADRIYHGDNERFVIHVLNSAGALELIFGREAPVVPVSEADIERAKEMYLDRPQRGAPPPAHVQEASKQRIRATPGRETLPAFDALRVADNGHVWVRHGGFPWDEHGRWDVFDARGIWLFSVDVPRELRITQIGADFLVGVRRDELDVEYVVRHELVRTGSPEAGE